MTLFSQSIHINSSSNIRHVFSFCWDGPGTLNIHYFFHGCFSWMIPNLYLKDCCLGIQGCWVFGMIHSRRWSVLADRYRDGVRYRPYKPP